MKTGKEVRSVCDKDKQEAIAQTVGKIQLLAAEIQGTKDTSRVATLTRKAREAAEELRRIATDG